MSFVVRDQAVPSWPVESLPCTSERCSPRCLTPIASLESPVSSPIDTSDDDAKVIARRRLLAYIRRSPQQLIVGLSDGVTTHAVNLWDIRCDGREWRIVYKDHFPAEVGTFLQENRNVLGVKARLESELGSLWSISEQEFFRLHREIVQVTGGKRVSSGGEKALEVSCDLLAEGMCFSIEGRVSLSVLFEHGTVLKESCDDNCTWLLGSQPNMHIVNIRLVPLPKHITEMVERQHLTDMDTIIQYAFSCSSIDRNEGGLIWRFVQAGEYPTGEPYLVVGHSASPTSEPDQESVSNAAEVEVPIVHGVTLHNDVVIDVSVGAVGETADPIRLMLKAIRVLLDIHRR